jgi:hypothetical protein
MSMFGHTWLTKAHTAHLNYTVECACGRKERLMKSACLPYIGLCFAAHSIPLDEVLTQAQRCDNYKMWSSHITAWLTHRRHRAIHHTYPSETWRDGRGEEQRGRGNVCPPHTSGDYLGTTHSTKEKRENWLHGAEPFLRSCKRCTYSRT